MAAKTKQKTEEQNGRIHELTPEAAQQVIDAAKRAKIERYLIERQRLDAEYGLTIDARPEYTPDGRTIVILFVREIQDNQRGV